VAPAGIEIQEINFLHNCFIRLLYSIHVTALKEYHGGSSSGPLVA
jgi:hypothetical protein